MYFLPRFTKAVPSSLVAIAVVSALVIGGGLPTKAVSDIASIAGGLPTFHLPRVPLSWHTLAVVLPYAFIMALVGLTGSLLTLNVIDEMTDTRGRGNQDGVARSQRARRPALHRGRRQRSVLAWHRNKGLPTPGFGPKPGGREAFLRLRSGPLKNG